MKIIELKNYGPIISSKTIGKEIFELIKSEIAKSDKVGVDLTGVVTMATFCAKQIFGQLYLQMGSSDFFEKITISGTDEDLRTIIQIGIQHALNENK